MNKKRVIGLSSLISMLPLVSAFDLSRGPEQVIQWIKDFSIPFFEALLDTGTYDQYFFSKILVLILLFIVIYSISSKLKFIDEDQIWIRFIIAAVISVVGMRYISDIDFVQGILLPYGVLAVAISVGLPLLIMFYFIEESLPDAKSKRFAWIIYLAIIIGIWADRSAELSRGANITYAIAIGIITLLIVFENAIQHTKIASKLNKFRKIRLQEILLDTEDSIAKNISRNASPDLINALKERRAHLLKEISKVS